jgi:hypothetical protein
MVAIGVGSGSLVYKVGGRGDRGGVTKEMSGRGKSNYDLSTDDTLLLTLKRTQQKKEWLPPDIMLRRI